MPSYTALYLAGGDGDRLKPLTRLIAGDDRPKQFCAVVGAKTLIAQTLERMERTLGSVPSYCAVNRDHRRFYRRELAPFPSLELLEQPANRGTATAIICGLETIRAQHGDAVVGIFPTDHCVTRPDAFGATIAAAYTRAAADTRSVYIVGARPDRAEPEYGWIEASAPTFGNPDEPRRVHSFWEKPTPEAARHMYAAGCVWNTFILLGRVSAFDALIDRAGDADVIAMRRAFGRGTMSDDEFLELPSVDFSKSVLQRSAGQLRLIELRDAGWTDLGRPSRVNEARQMLRLPALILDQAAS